MATGVHLDDPKIFWSPFLPFQSNPQLSFFWNYGRCNRLRCPLARLTGLQSFNMGHNDNGINLFGVVMILIGNLHAGGQSNLGHLSLVHRLKITYNRISHQYATFFYKSFHNMAAGIFKFRGYYSKVPTDAIRLDISGELCQQRMTCGIYDCTTCILWLTGFIIFGRNKLFLLKWDWLTTKQGNTPGSHNVHPSQRPTATYKYQLTMVLRGRRYAI